MEQGERAARRHRVEPALHGGVDVGRLEQFAVALRLLRHDDHPVAAPQLAGGIGRVVVEAARVGVRRLERQANLIRFAAGRPSSEQRTDSPPLDRGRQVGQRRVRQRSVLRQLTASGELPGALAGELVQIGRRRLDGLALVDDKEGVRRKVIEERRPVQKGAVERGHGEGAASKGRKFGRELSSPLTVRTAVGEPGGKRDEFLAGGEPLGCGADVDARETRGRPLRARLEGADRLDCVPEPLDADGGVAVWWEDIEQAAAACCLACHLDERPHRVAGLYQSPRNRFERHPLADRDRARAAGEIRGGQRALDGGRDRRDEQGRPRRGGAREVPQRGDAAGGRRRRRPTLVGKVTPRG